MEYSRYIDKILFLDIETAAIYPNYMALEPKLKSMWSSKAKSIKKFQNCSSVEDESGFYRSHAGIFSEFSRVVCVSFGFVEVLENEKFSLKTKTFFNQEENRLLNDVSQFIRNNMDTQTFQYFCGHNIREFDIPFLCRRMTAQRVLLPETLKLHGKKPWQVKSIIDTLELWRFGDFKNYISLENLVRVLNIDSPKLKISGQDVHDYFWIKKDFHSIGQYCEMDVKAVVEVFLALSQIDHKYKFVFESRTDEDIYK